MLTSGLRELVNKVKEISILLGGEKMCSPIRCVWLRERREIYKKLCGSNVNLISPTLYLNLFIFFLFLSSKPNTRNV